MRELLHIQYAMELVPSDIVDGRAYELDIAPVIERDELVIRPVDMPVNSGEHFDIFFDQVVCFCACTLRVRDIENIERVYKELMENGGFL